MFSQPQETSAKKSPKKPTKPGDLFHPEQSIDLAKEVPAPTRILYPPHPLEDCSNRFYELEFYKLYAEIEDWTNIYFGAPDLTTTEWESDVGDGVWTRVREMPEFVQWAEMVAEEDAEMGGWENMIANGVNRKWFVAAVIVKIIKHKVFDELLFGGTKEEKEMLFSMERAMFQREGVFALPLFFPRDLACC